MIRRSSEIERPLARLRGRAGFAAGELVLTACPVHPPLRGWWLEGYLEAVKVSVGPSRVNSFAAFPVEPLHEHALWSPIERDALRIGRALGLPHGVLARLLGRSPGAVKVEACRLGQLARRLAA
jgi:hypothetical protein